MRNNKRKRERNEENSQLERRKRQQVTIFNLSGIREGGEISKFLCVDKRRKESFLNRIFRSEEVIS